MNRRFLVALLGGSTLLGACFDLDVETIQPTSGTTYTRAEILASPVLMERVVGGTFTNFWGAVSTSDPWIVLSIFGEELTSSANTFSTPVFEHVAEPRAPFNNTLNSEEGTNLVRTPWSFFYEANSSAVEFPGIVKREGIRIIDPSTNADNTNRFLAFGKFVSGLSHVYLGLLFDSAAVVGESLDLSVPQVLPLAPYQEVIDSGIMFLEEAIEIATQNDFVFPLNEGQWIFNTGFDNIQLRAVAHAYIARALAYGARTREERFAADWARVKEHVLLATTNNFGPRGIPDNSVVSTLYRRAVTAPPDQTSVFCNSSCDGGGLMRVDLRVVGPGDTTGAYQQWLQDVNTSAFPRVPPVTIASPDQRIQEPGGSTPNAKPRYYKVTDVFPPQTSMDTTIRGSYYVSFYWSSSRAVNNHTQLPRDGGGRNRSQDLDDTPDEMLTAVEMRLLLAEAEYHLGNLQAAANIINESRVLNGELPPVTAAGVPAGPGCVPKRFDGSCGDLWDALVYEKRMETYGTGIAFFDARGWGCMLPGTPTQLPIPATQRDIMGKPVYTYGGQVGQVGSAPVPTQCPLLHRP